MLSSVAVRLGRAKRGISSPTFLVVLAIVPLAILSSLGTVLLAGTKTGVAVALLAAVGPLAAYLALTAPLVFPFCIYVLLLPFDNLLSFSNWGTLTKALGVVCGAMVALWLLRTRRLLLPDRAFVAWLLFVAWAVASVAWAMNADDAWPLVTTLLLLFLLYAVLAFVSVDTKTLRIVAYTVVASGTIAAAYGAYLFEHGLDVAMGGRLLVSGNFLVNNDITSHIDPNNFAASLLVPIAFALVLTLESKHPLAQFIGTACLLIMGAGIAFSGSRGSMVAIAAMVLFLLIRSPKGLLAAGFAIAGVGMAFVLDGQTLMQRLGTATSTGGAGRLEIWKVGLALILRHPLIGVGFGNFPDAYNQIIVTAGLSALPFWNVEPHSDLLWIVVELGIVGLAIFLYATWAQFRSLVMIERDQPLYSLRTALEAGWIALFVASLFLGMVTYKYFWLPIVLFALTRNAALGVASRPTPLAERTPGRTLASRRFA